RSVGRPGPEASSEAGGAQPRLAAGLVRGEGPEYARPHDVVLRGRTVGRDERAGDGRAGHDREHRDAEGGPAVPPESPHVSPFPRRIRGSIHATATSVRRFPATTNTAVTTVAAMTTG